MAQIEFLRKRIKELEEEKRLSAKELREIEEKIAQADAKRRQEEGMRNYHKWNTILGGLERNLDRAKARLQMCEIELRDKRANLKRREQHGETAESEPEATEADEPVVEETAAEVPPEPAPANTRASREKQRAMRRLLGVLEKVAQETVSALTLEEAAFLAECYEEKKAQGPSSRRMADAIDSILKQADAEFAELRARWLAARHPERSESKPNAQGG